MSKSKLALVAVALVAFSAGGFAQGHSWKLQCQSVGGGGPEPLGDREGHSVAVGQYNCRAEGGPMDGAVLTGNAVWEWDKGSAANIGGFGVYRKAGATLVYQHSQGQNKLLMADGKPTGWKATGTGVATMATGSAASLKGMKLSYVAASTAPGMFTVDVKAE